VSHTASLAGEDRLYEALFDRVGVARAHTVPQFLETLKFVSTVGALPANTVGSMSCSGGEASLVADAAEAVGLDMPPLSEESGKGLFQVLGPKVPLSNPLDYHTYIWGDYEKLTECFSTMLGNGYACTILVIDYPTPKGADTSSWQVSERALARAIGQTGERAVIVSSIPETIPESARIRLQAAGITPMQGIEDCLFAIRAAATIGAAQSRAGATRPVLKPAAPNGDASSLDEWESKKELAGFGLAVPEGRRCDAAGTVAAAVELGFPVVLKAVSRELAHKSEAGAVAVNLSDADAVAAATARMAQQFDELLVERMAAPVVVELIIGVNRDPDFGLTLLVGAGGTLVELVDDTSSLLLPADEADIRAAIGSLRVAKLIHSFRGAAAGDLEATIAAVRIIADYAVSMNDRLIELDVNPLIVMPDGAVAVDAFIRRIGVGSGSEWGRSGVGVGSDPGFREKSR